MAASLSRLRRLAARLRARLPLSPGAEDDRDAALCREACGLVLDLRREWLDGKALRALCDYAKARSLPEGVAALFAGEPVNRSERRPALHIALRGEGPAAAAREAERVLRAMEALAARAAEDPSAFGLEAVEHLLHVGIGGSLSGPRLIVDFFPPRAGRKVHFLSNADGRSLAALLAAINPRRSLLFIASKSFTTAETLANARALVEALAEQRGVSEAEVLRAALAVTSHPERAQAFGIAAEAILPLPEGVGGRFSACSAVSFSALWLHGASVFRAILAGAAAMDRHLREAPPAENLPLLAALADFWNRSVLKTSALCLLPYADRLAALLPFVQQLMMESNGKGVDADGRPLSAPAAPAVFGQVGCDAEHALVQWLAQGLEPVPVEFVAVPPQPGCPLDRLRSEHLLAQWSRLAAPREEAEPHRRAGPRPTRLLALLDERPETLGALIAFYEHRVYLQALLWGNNAFDQWGVEAGKALAREIALSRRGRAPPPEDPWLKEWLRRWP
jgi:glucose-6-phosphate isomerase